MRIYFNFAAVGSAKAILLLRFFLRMQAQLRRDSNYCYPFYNCKMALKLNILCLQTVYNCVLFSASSEANLCIVIKRNQKIIQRLSLSYYVLGIWLCSTDIRWQFITKHMQRERPISISRVSKMKRWGMKLCLRSPLRDSHYWILNDLRNKFPWAKLWKRSFST